MKGLVDFIKTSIIIIKSCNNSWIPYYLYEINKNLHLDELEKLNYDLSTIFKLWMNENLKEKILIILKIIYTLDAINVITKLKKEKYWCFKVPCGSSTVSAVSGYLLVSFRVLFIMQNC
jgi:hypothetical protein